MSSEKPVDPGRHSFERLAKYLDEARIDPVLKDMFLAVPAILDEVRRRIVECDEKPFVVIDEELRPLNESLSKEWEGVAMAVTGKARIYDRELYWSGEDSDRSADESGDYVLLSGQKYVCCGFDGSVGDDGVYDGGPIGLVIVPEDDYDGLEYIEPVSALVLRPEDVDNLSVRFDKPSCRAIELDLKQGP